MSAPAVDLGTVFRGSPRGRFAAAHGVRPMIEELPMTEENINAAMDRLKRGDVRYRFVLKSQRTDAE